MTASNNIALVTGAAKRIGRTIALDLAQAGWAVAVHHNRSAAEANEVVTAITSRGGLAVALAADLADAGAVARLVPACILALGPPTLLVNNASLFLPDNVGAIDVALWDRHQAINLRAPVMLAQALAATLPPGAEGNVINIIDQRVWRPSPQFFSYGVSKSGLLAANTMLAQALAPRIRVNAIGPGPVLQSIHQSAEEFAAQERAMPLGHGTDPAEIAATIRFLLAAHAMTGQMIALDGGQHLDWRLAAAATETSLISPPLAPLAQAVGMRLALESPGR